jgi:hypothetical protein
MFDSNYFDNSKVFKFESYTVLFLQKSSSNKVKHTIIEHNSGLLLSSTNVNLKILLNIITINVWSAFF